MPPNTWIAVSPTVASRPANAFARSAARCRSSGRRPCICGPQRVDHAAAGQLDGLVHVDAQMLDRLKRADHLTELLSDFCVFDGEVHDCPRGAERVGGSWRSARRRSPPSTASGDAVASRCAGVPSSATRNCLRVWSIPRSGVTEIPGESVFTAKSPVPVGILGEHQQDVGGRGVGHGGDLAPQHRVVRPVCWRRRSCIREVQEADGGDRGAVGDPGQELGRRIAAAEPGQRPRARRPRSTTTAPDAAPAPSSSATMPASTIVMPAPPYSSGTSSPVVPRSARPRQTASVDAGRIVEQLRAHGPKSVPSRQESAAWCRAAPLARR